MRDGKEVVQCVFYENVSMENKQTNFFLRSKLNKYNLSLPDNSNLHIITYTKNQVYSFHLLFAS